MGRIENMNINTKLIYHAVLAAEALLVVFQLATRQEAWVSMMCFWLVVVMMNISYIIDERKKDKDRN